MPFQQGIFPFVIQSEKDYVWEAARLYLKIQSQIKDPLTNPSTYGLSPVTPLHN